MTHPNHHPFASPEGLVMTPASLRVVLGFCTALVGWGLSSSGLSQELLTGHSAGRPPVTSIGREAQWYLDLDTSNVWLKSSGLWTTSGTLNSTATSYGIYSATVLTPGINAVPGDLITPAIPGATAVTPSTLRIAQTQVVSATAASSGTGCTVGGPYTVTGTTGTASPVFQASLMITSGSPVVLGITRPGAYGTNPTLAGEAITGVPGCSVQPTLNLTMGALALGISGTPQIGNYSSIPSASPTASISSTTGTESGLTMSVNFAPLASGVFPANQSAGQGPGSPIWDVAYGYGALGSLTTGVENTAFGWNTLASLTSGNYNVAIGTGAAWFENGTYNTIIGGDAARNWTGRNFVVGVGRDALRNVIGQRNVAIGEAALGAYKTGDTLAGVASDDMIAIGYQAANGQNLSASATGDIFIGGYSGYNITTALRDNALGYLAMQQLTSGTDNAAFGTYTLQQNQTGSSNTAFGSGALTVFTASFSTAVGSFALQSDVSGIDTAMGFIALQKATAGNNSAFGSASGSTITTGDFNALFGNNTLRYSAAGSQGNTIVGESAAIGNSGTPSTLLNNTIVGNQALGNATIGAANNNSALGAFTLQHATTASNNTTLGTSGLNALTTGTNNIAIGYGAGQTVLTTGNSNILIGTNVCDAAAAGETDTFRLCESTGSVNLLTGSLNATTPSLLLGGNTGFQNNLIASVTAGTGASCTVASTCHNNAGRITVGTTPGTTIVLAFNAANAFPTTPVCFAQDETSAVTMRATTISTTGVTFTASGALTAADKVSYTCAGI